MYIDAHTSRVNNVFNIQNDFPPPFCSTPSTCVWQTILHIAVSFNTSYHNKKSRRVFDRFKIMKHYFSGYFFLDLLAGQMFVHL